MAKKSNNSVAARAAGRIWLACAILLAALWPAAAPACPFCTAVGPSLAQLRQQADVTALAEVEAGAAAGRSRVRLHRVLAGAERLKGQGIVELSLDVSARPGSLLVIFGTGPASAPAGELAWHAVPVNETSYAYFARSPSLKAATAERLRYFARFLEHADPLVAEDAYREFARAPFDEVARVTDVLPPERMRGWLADPQVPPTHKGFYGLALGMVGDAAARLASAEFLRRLILAPEDDFRAGFDGILGGYLLLTGSAGLELIETRYLANPKAADGDVRHALTALRFYREYGREIPLERQQRALRKLLARREFAADAITDLARWKDWGALDAIRRLSVDEAVQQPTTRRAIVGYLLVCPGPMAADALAALRKLDPQGVASAEDDLMRTSGIGPAERQ